MSYTQKDASKDTNSNISEVKEAWHDAREDAQAVGELNERAENKGVENVPRDEPFHERAVSSAQDVSDSASDYVDSGSSGK